MPSKMKKIMKFKIMTQHENSYKKNYTCSFLSELTAVNKCKIDDIAPG